MKTWKYKKENNFTPDGIFIIIAKTANISEKNREKCLVSGSDDYFIQAFRRDELVAGLIKHIS